MSADTHPVEPVDRFLSRASFYARYRPAYPDAVIAVLRRRAGLTRDSVVVDVGSGTGLSAALFLANGNVVYGVEPNAEMRAEAERQLRPQPRFHSVDGRAEDTTLPAHCADFVVAATAFHWFQLEAAQREFARILKPTGYAVLLWQDWRNQSPLANELDELLRRHCPDYRNQLEPRMAERTPVLVGLFGRGGWRDARLCNEQIFDWDGLRGRILSMSFIPGEDWSGWPALEDDLRHLFSRHAFQGKVNLAYRVQIFFGYPHGPSSSPHR